MFQEAGLMNLEEKLRQKGNVWAECCVARGFGCIGDCCEEGGSGGLEGTLTKPFLEGNDRIEQTPWPF